ncbi:hypothetical protein GCM10009838_18140 [Catenulispora subtropica]|uniref:Uncharacterized protein n=1 Tax=Catenulispora subtropica TaxID=450798 RepID=A0ABN2R1E8_9ACTN
MKFGQDCAGEAFQGGRVGKDLDNVGSAFDLAVEALKGVGRPEPAENLCHLVIFVE